MMREYPTFERIKIKDRHNKTEQRQQKNGYLLDDYVQLKLWFSNDYFYWFWDVKEQFVWFFRLFIQTISEWNRWRCIDKSRV